jgi:uncharacterized membrane protein
VCPAPSSAGGTGIVALTLICRTFFQERHMETYDPDKNPTEVRQASPRKMNLRVLVTSMVAVVVIFAIIFIVYSVMQPAQT